MSPEIVREVESCVASCDTKVITFVDLDLTRLLDLCATFLMDFAIG